MSMCSDIWLLEQVKGLSLLVYFLAVSTFEIGNAARPLDASVVSTLVLLYFDRLNIGQFKLINLFELLKFALKSLGLLF